MALIGPDGEQHSHLSKRDVADPAPGSGPHTNYQTKVQFVPQPLPPRAPDKGRWVGPPRGQGPEWPKESTMPTPHEEAVLKAMQRPAEGEPAISARRQAVEALITLIDGELLPDQRRILIQALAVVGMLP